MQQMSKDLRKTKQKTNRHSASFSKKPSSQKNLGVLFHDLIHLFDIDKHFMSEKLVEKENSRSSISKTCTRKWNLGLLDYSIGKV